MNMLADNVGRRTHLVVVEFVSLGHDVRVHILRAVEGVHAQHHRLRRTFLVDCRYDILPQRNDALLGEVIAELVQDRIELDVGRLVNTW